MRKTKRVSLTIPIELDAQINNISSSLGITKSSLISELLNSSIGPLTEVVEMAIGALEEDSSGTKRLSRDPRKIRAFIDGLTTTLKQNAESAEHDINSLDSRLNTLIGDNNEH